MSKALILSGGGFRECLEKAVRVDVDHHDGGGSNNDDWSPHCVDYARFKQRLKYFARRRSQIRTMIANQSDHRLSEEILRDLCGPKQRLRAAKKLSAVSGDNSSNNNKDENLKAYYQQMPLSEHIGLPNVVNVPSQQQQTPPSASDYVEMGDSADYLEEEGNLSQQSSGGDSNASGGAPAAAASNKRRDQRYIMRRLSIAERNEIIIFLEWEMDKVCMFYLSQWQKLTGLLEQQQERQQLAVLDSDGRLDATAWNDLLDPDLGSEILELLAFCVMNVITVQQILVRYDAFARAYEGTPMMNYYMKKITKHPTSFRKILHHEELQAVASGFVAGSEDVPFVQHFHSQQEMFQDLLSSLQSAEAIAELSDVSLTDAFMYSVRKLFLVGLFEDRLGLEPAYLTGRGQSLKTEIERIAEWRRKKQDYIIAKTKPKEKELSGMQVFHLTLNLLAAFLYCMNYYIVEPSSTMYVNRLGAHDAMSGTLIGMMPLAAFVSSIPYSMWTNKSFRHPFLMSCCMLVTGNLMYSIADQFKGKVWIALVGRFISGLGAPKCIIRRYMADTTPVSLRTGVNAGFGMVVAAGSAMGPAMAIILNKFEYVGYFKPMGGLVCLNGLTLPGYFMATCWMTFGLIVLATFEEPDRAGLKEQKELEARGAIPCTPSNVSASGSKAGSTNDDMTIFSGDSSFANPVPSYDYEAGNTWIDRNLPKRLVRIIRFFDLITLPVRICLGLLFCKVFVIESLVSATSALTKNRYKWQVHQVGSMGLTNGLLVIPFSIMVGRMSMSYQDHVLMKWLISIGCFGMFLLIDLTDLVATPTRYYNEGHALAVSPPRYIIGYFLSYLSIQAFEGVIGSTLSKVIPTALASGTFNSGLLATLVDTFGRTCGDLFISAAGFVSLRQLMNLLFIPGFAILLTCLIVIERCRDMLSV